jgi:hypothetical protein
LDLADVVERKFRMFFNEIVHNKLNQLPACFSNTEKVEFFFGLMNCEKSDAYRLKRNFPDQFEGQLERI